MKALPPIARLVGTVLALPAVLVLFWLSAGVWPIVGFYLAPFWAVFVVVRDHYQRKRSRKRRRELLQRIMGPDDPVVDLFLGD